jgi:two-component system, chemotaxis family, response regulator Rcp1
VAHRVLLSIEDSDADYYLIKLAVRESGLPVQVCRVSDGEKALHFLHRSNGYEVAPRPDLVLLDLNLPRRNGLQVLSDMRTIESFGSIPVVVFSSSRLSTDRTQAIAAGANHYITKPTSFDALIEVVGSVCSRFLTDDCCDCEGE